MGHFVLDDGEQIGCGLAQAFIGSHFWERHGVREPINSESVSNTKRAGDVAFVAAAVLSGGPDVPAIDSVRGHVGSLLRCDVDDDASARWRERTLVKIVIAVETGVGREFGFATRGAKQI